MPRLLKEGQERKVSLSVAIEPKVLEGVDQNIKTLHSWLKSKYGVTDKELKEISRSYFIRECLTLFSRPECVETTAMGAAFLAGLASGFWKDQAELRHIWREDRSFSPALGEAERLRRVENWNRAVRRSLDWIPRG